MSEYCPEIAGKYTELMTPAFVNGLAHSDEFTNPMPDSALGSMLLQPAVRHLLLDVDWGNQGLPVKEWDYGEAEIGEKSLSPGHYAERLMAFAFDDARVLMQLAETFRDTHGLPEDVTLRALLINSKKTLLMAGRLEDPVKNKLYRAIEYPDVAQVLLHDVELPHSEHMLQLALDRSGEYRFDWHRVIQAFLEDNIHEGRGCPAHHKIITDDDGKKQTLIYYFWDKLVDFAYKN